MEILRIDSRTRAVDEKHSPASEAAIETGQLIVSVSLDLSCSKHSARRPMHVKQVLQPAELAAHYFVLRMNTCPFDKALIESTEIVSEHILERDSEAQRSMNTCLWRFPGSDGVLPGPSLALPQRTILTEAGARAAARAGMWSSGRSPWASSGARSSNE